MWNGILIALVIIFMAVMTYSCCVMSGRCNEIEEQRHLMEEWQNEHRTKD